MPQTQTQRAAADRVGAWLANNDLTITWLSEAAGADAGTIGDFLSYKRWPKVGTQGRIEKALGWHAGAIRQMGYGNEVEVPMTRHVDASDAQEERDEEALTELREAVAEMRGQMERAERLLRRLGGT